MFFEGSEKKFELSVRAGSVSLRSRPIPWDHIVRSARAEILSRMSNADMDTYLLSESSLFVMDDRVIMITCGTTTLIHAAIKLLEYVDPADLELFVYERKNEQMPGIQHTSFDDDVALLNARLPGCVFCFGNQASNHIRLYHLDRPFTPPRKDTTLEILMHDLSPRMERVFSSDNGFPADQIAQHSGLASIFPDFRRDAHLFNPMGFSLNAIKGPEYYTVHVTPQRSCSYASFETNHFLRGDISDTVSGVVSIFEPRVCLVMLFQPEKGDCRLHLPWSARNRAVENLGCGYRVDYRHYRFDPEDGVDGCHGGNANKDSRGRRSPWMSADPECEATRN